MSQPPLPRLAIVGPCSSGKTTLATALKSLGFEVRQPAQEHSYVRDMWRKLSRPDLLIYLDVDYPTSRQRRPHLDGGPERLAEQQARLAHARAHADFFLDTSELNPTQVQRAVLTFLHSLGLPLPPLP